MQKCFAPHDRLPQNPHAKARRNRANLTLINVLLDPAGKFVMWMHIDTADYELARLGVAVSNNPIGPFRYMGSFRPHGQQSRDFTVYAVGQFALTE